MRTTRIVLLLTFVLSLCVGVFAVEYNTGQPISLNIKTSARTVGPGQQIHLYLTANDVDYVLGQGNVIQERINDPLALTWQASDGTLTKFTAVGTQPVDLLWAAPAQPGYYAVFITARDSGKFANDAPVRAIIELSVKQLGGGAIVPAVRVSANPQTLIIRKTNATVITAQVLGTDVANKTVGFFTTSGALSATSVKTDANGLASVQLSASANDLGTAEVAAFYGNTTATTSVEITDHAPTPRQPDQPLPRPVLPPYRPDFTISVDPPSIPADGRSTANVTVRLTDGRGLGISRQNVDFRITYGRIAPRGLTDRTGYATVQLAAPDQPAVAVITAQAGALRSYTTVEFSRVQQQAPTGPPHLYIAVTPTLVAADGASKILVGAQVLDSNGYAVPNALIEFSSTLGTVQYPQVTTTTEGQAGTYLIAPTMPGIAVVTARLGQIAAASQVVFQGTTPVGGGLSYRWNGQQTGFVTERWLYREIQLNNGKQGNSTKALMILDDFGTVIKQLELGSTAKPVRDEYGQVRGYGREQDGLARIELYNPDGSLLRAVTVKLPVGSHLNELAFADPAGTLLVTTKMPDDTHPQLYYFSATGQQLFALTDGLEKLPLASLSGDGYLALALAGGTVRIYSPDGQVVSEASRTDGLPATQVAVGPAGAWVAVASALAGQTEAKPQLTVFSRQGAPLVKMDLDVQRLAPAGTDGVLISTTDATCYLSLASKILLWSIPGGFDHALAVDSNAIIAGQRDPKTQALISRVTIVRLRDGKVLGTQAFDDLREIRAILPPNTDGQVGMVAADYTIRFPIPADK